MGVGAIASSYAPAGGGPTILSTATAWWVAAERSSGDLTDMTGGGRTMVDSGSPTFTNDGTHEYVDLNQAGSQYFAAATSTAWDIDASGPYTVVMVTKPQAVSDTTDLLISNRSGSANGWNLFLATGTASSVLDSGANASASAATLSAGTRYTIALIVTATHFRVVVNGTAGTPVARPNSGAATTNTEELRINRGAGATALYADQDFYGAAVFKGVELTDAETVTVGTELLAATEL